MEQKVFSKQELNNIVETGSARYLEIINMLESADFTKKKLFYMPKN